MVTFNPPQRVMEELPVKERPIDKWVEKYGYRGYISSFEDQQHFVLEIKQANFLYDPPMPNMLDDECNKFIWDVIRSGLGYLLPSVPSSPMQYNLPVGKKKWIKKGEVGYDKITKNLSDITYGYSTGYVWGVGRQYESKSFKDNETAFRVDKKDWYKPKEDRGDIEISDLIFSDDILRKYNPYYKEVE